VAAAGWYHTRYILHPISAMAQRDTSASLRRPDKDGVAHGEVLQRGAWFLKYPKGGGAPEPRFVRCSDDLSILSWAPSAEEAASSKSSTATFNIMKVCRGRGTEVFRKYHSKAGAPPIEEQTQRSLSVQAL